MRDPRNRAYVLGILTGIMIGCWLMVGAFVLEHGWSIL